jgi:predicted RNA-binding protein (TIGR00451 family)
MFRKFSKDEVSGINQVKSSVVRGIRGERERRQSRRRRPAATAADRAPAQNQPTPQPPQKTASLASTYPWLEESGVLDVLIPKKDPPLSVAKVGYVQVALVNGEPRFFADRDGPWFPTLRVLHQYPQIMKRVRADKGAIKFVLSGANVMCPGLTSPGATMHDELDQGEPVAVYAEGAEEAMAVGVMALSTADVRGVNKGVGVELTHYLNDGLWKAKTLT